MGLENWDGLATLLAATLAFVVCHVGISSTPLRGLLVKKLGEMPYQGFYSLLNLAALVWMVMAFRAAPRGPLWAEGADLHVIPLVVLPFALFFVGAGYMTRNPTVVGQEASWKSDSVARGIQRITRHPSLTGIFLWAVSHMVAVGDGAALIFFGGFAVLAGWGPFLIDQRRRRSMGKDWERYAAQTSLLPFGAIVTGRNRLALGEIGWLPFAVTALLYAVLLFAHPWFSGVDAF